MDELLHHCLRELSFDGDLGCNVSRLKDFIVDFYEHATTSHSQTTDDTFCAFIWSLIVQQPTVLVGTIPPGVTSEVYIAPQTSAKRKAKAKGEEHIETSPPVLDIVPDAKSRPLDELRREYGDALRIAVDPDATYAAITGSHIRFPKLSPMVYSALQIITRGRDSGITVVGLGQQSKYDQKTCFYLVRQLTELDLVVKVRRGGVGTHFCLHRYFFDRSPSWKAIRDEETRAEDSQRAAPSEQSYDVEEDRGTLDVQPLDFTPIDARHLSSLPLIRARVIKLLKASRNYMHASNNMLITLGFSNPTKTDRRFFQSRIREMIQQGLIEKVVVPSNKKKSVSASVKCFRLVSTDKVDDEGLIVQPQEGEDDEKDDGTFGDQSGVKMNLTIHKQIIDLLEDSDTTGMTLNELSSSLCHFDKRTIELLLTRAEKYPPPAHLSDLGIAGLMETSGRERRHRYYTIASYRKLVAREKLDKSSAGYADVDFLNVGGFLPVDENMFYQDEAALFNYQDVYKDGVKAKSGKARKHALKNPVLADGAVKQGRPRKYPLNADGDTVMGDGKIRRRATKRKRVDADDGNPSVGNQQLAESKAKKRRTEVESEPDVALVLSEDDNIIAASSKKRDRSFDSTTELVQKVPRKRGRPPNAKQVLEDEEITTKTPKKRGRPKKQKQDIDEDKEEHLPNKRGRTPKRKPGTKEPSEPIPASKERDYVRKRPQTIEDINTESLLNAEESVAGPSSVTFVREESPSLLTGLHLDSEVIPLQTTAVIIEDVPNSHETPTYVKDAIAVHSETRDDEDGNLAGLPQPNTSSTLEYPIFPRHAGPTLEHVSTPVISVPIDPSLLGVAETPEIIPHDAAFSADMTLDPSLLADLGALNAEKSRDVEVGESKLSSSSRTRVNVSHLRRENELYRVVENFGGIVNIQTKEFYEGHMALIETLAQAGEPTSSPVGTRTDKRTATTTFNNMERRGRIKQLKTSVTTHTGVRRPACIVYLPTIEQAQLNDFLSELGRGIQAPAPQMTSYVKINERLEYGADPGPIVRGALPLQLLQMEQPGDDRKERWSKNSARADQLFSYDDATIREVLLTERTTLGQLYGFIVGKAARARELHLSVLDAFESGNTSSHIVSHEHRIIDVSFFGHDLPLDLYCSLISSLSHDDELTQFFNSKEGRRTIVRDLPTNLHSVMQIGRSRARSRILDILEMLRTLNLVTPLQASDSDSPLLTCQPNGEYPTSFDVATLDGWTVNTPITAPVFWQFKIIAPLYLWAASESAPPFWQDVSVASRAEGQIYWHLLQDACTNNSIEVGLTHDSAVLPTQIATTSTARSLRRTVSWNSDYVLTWHQTQYLKRFVDFSSGKTPLDDGEEGAARIKNIAWVISAPEDVAREYLKTTHEKWARDLEKTRKNSKHHTAENRAKRTAEAKALLARKAADARIQRERDWDALVHRIHPSTLSDPASVRVRQVQTRFLQAGSISDIHKWEGEIMDAVHEANLVVNKTLKTTSKWAAAPRAVATAVLPLAAANPPEKSIELLIAEQGPPLPVGSERAKRKRKIKNSSQDSEVQPDMKAKSVRRHRFQWNRDYEELARDASAIIRARCRNLPRLDWGAFEQVFPAVPRNTVRQRLAHIKENPGNEAYLNRLEDRWYNLWMQHRGTPLLPDDDLQSATKFNLIKHIEFLRNHVDKNALRVGYVQQKEDTGIAIPATVDQLLDEFEVIESVPAAPVWDFMWNATVEDGREKRLLRQPFNKNVDVMTVSSESSSDTVYMAESALKMVLGTPHDCYDADSASKLLHGVGELTVMSATKNLVSRGVLSKLVRDPQKQKPGRQLKISEINQNAIGGLISKDTFQDATALEEISVQENAWREWPLLASDGDNAALIQLVSENQIEFKIDTSQAQLARPMLDWNSKKADDDQIETAIHVRFGEKSTRISPSSGSSPSLPYNELGSELTGHGLSVDDEAACCRRLSDDGFVDCVACLEEEWLSFSSPLDLQERDRAAHVLMFIRQAGEQGVEKSVLKANFNSSSGQIFSIIRRMTEAAVPLLFWTGYSSVVLVSSVFLKYWTVLVSEKPAVRMLPRRWFDISGSKLVDHWEAALRAVMGVIIFRPGISQTELRWRLRSAYDRQEIGDILHYLQEEGFIKMRCNLGVLVIGENESTVFDDREESMVFWFIGDTKHWYQV